MKILFLLAAIAMVPIGQAEEIAIPVGAQGISGISLPAKGLTMNEVESLYGAAKVQHEATGKPPITRWEYENYIVYFEGERVIHSVLRHKPKAQFQTPND